MKQFSESKLLLVVGTGTEIGKTEASCAYLRSLAASSRSRQNLLGAKPVESGYREEHERDSRRLLLASTFRSAAERIALEVLLQPVHARPNYAPPTRVDTSPTISLVEAITWVRRLLDASDFLLIETAGGLFSPMPNAFKQPDGRTALVSDFVRETAVAFGQYAPKILLVAPNELGVLHQIGAATRAAAADGISIDGLALNQPITGEALFTAEDVAVVTSVPVVATVSRGTSSAAPQFQWAREHC